MAVVGTSLVGMLVYAGLFYSNSRRTIPASSEMDSSLYKSREKAEKAANESISLGGIYAVEMLAMARCTLQVTALEKKKLKTQNDQSMRRKIEANIVFVLTKLRRIWLGSCVRMACVMQFLVAQITTKRYQ